MLIDRFESNNWMLTTFISKASLMERGKIVILFARFFFNDEHDLDSCFMMPAIFRITKPIMRLYHAMNAVSSGKSAHVRSY